MTAVSMLVGAGLGTALAAYVLYRNHRAELDRRRLLREAVDAMMRRPLKRWRDD